VAQKGAGFGWPVFYCGGLTYKLATRSCVTLGRPELGGEVQSKILALVASSPGMSSYALAKAAGCDIKTAAKYRPAA
jgi:hypothetical protein